MTHLYFHIFKKLTSFFKFYQNDFSSDYLVLDRDHMILLKIYFCERTKVPLVVKLKLFHLLPYEVFFFEILSISKFHCIASIHCWFPFNSVDVFHDSFPSLFQDLILFSSNLLHFKMCMKNLTTLLCFLHYFRYFCLYLVLCTESTLIYGPLSHHDFTSNVDC